MYRSARSASHLSVEGSSIGSHQLVSRFMKGIYELRPPQPWVFTTWDVATVLRYLKKFHPAGTLSLTLSVPDLFLRTYTSIPDFLHASEFFVKHGGDMKQGTFKRNLLLQ